MRIAVIGCGTLGEAIVGGLIASDPGARGRIVATTRRRERADELEVRHGISVTLDNAAAVRDADVAVVSVKPQTAAQVFPELAADADGKVVVSTCAGIRLASIERWLPRGALIRSMPNTPALIREGMTVLAAGRDADTRAVDAARSIFGAVGRVLVLDEKHMDVVTGLSGSGPAFAFVMLEALADGGVMMGLPRAAAFELAAQTMQGAARLVLESHLHPAALKDQVTTPAGCTIAGLLTLEDGRIRSTLARAIQEATRVAGQLG